mgnify:CR=1 FL=1
MQQFDELMQLEPMIRLGGFVLLIGLLSWLQWQFPFRGDPNQLRRSMTNLSLSLINTLIMRFVFPLLAVAWSVEIYQQNVGMFAWLQWPLWASIPLAILMFDLAIYVQHRWMHTIPVLWRVHRVHHIDREMDFTTGIRFHPLEIMLSMAVKLLLITLLGPHPLAVLIFEVLLSLFALWTHTNVALPKTLDRMVRWVLVTPSMHRIHHSSWQPETDANYGFHLSWWDRLFRSYRDQPRADEQTMPLGLDEYATERDQRLMALLLNPFRSTSHH